MKKLNLNVANLGATEILSREELKKVLGGTGTGTGSDGSYVDCSSYTNITDCEAQKDSNCKNGFGQDGDGCSWIPFSPTQQFCMCSGGGIYP